MENLNGKKTLGRRKIPMRKIEKKSSLQVAFTKRRGGLFRKASELSILCGAEVAILVQSPSQKLYAFGHPSSVADLISRIDPSPPMKVMEAEKRRATEKEIKGGFWSGKRYEGLELHELEGIRTALDDFGGKIAHKLEPIFPAAQSYVPPLLQLQEASSSNQDQIIPTYTLDQIWGTD